MEDTERPDLRLTRSHKSCGNDVAAAIASFRNAQDLNITTKASTIPPPCLGTPRPTEAKSTTNRFNEPPPLYAELPADGITPASNSRDSDKISLDGDLAAFRRLDIAARAVDEPRPAPSPSPSAAPTPSAVPRRDEQWDFRLPQVVLDTSEEDFSVDEGRSNPFSPRRLLSVLQHGMPPGRLQHYISFFSAAAVRAGINGPVCGYPAIFYLVATNDEKLVRAWVGSGGDVNAVEPYRRIPLLAFAILLGSIAGMDSTQVVVTLLSLGADATVVPRVFFSPYVEDPVDKLPMDKGHAEFGEEKKQWCVEWMRPMLATAATLTMRYFLEKTVKEKGPTDRQLQVAQTHRATALLGVSFFLIGQTSATRSVTQKLLTHMAMPRSKPLVMVFAGMCFLRLWSDG